VELKALRYFVKVSELGGFARAADALGTSQSNISVRIARLEKEVGAPVFTRHYRGVELTPKGKVLYGYARRVFDLLEEASQSLHDRDAA
jgi:DNA-binding transcriptional LysR family regulator